MVDRARRGDRPRSPQSPLCCLVAAIASTVGEQGAATAEIARNVAEAATGTEEVTSNIVGVNTAARQTGASACRMLAYATSLSVDSTTLKTHVDAFLAQERAA
jgi:methyl-accepting chemotaxis protein